MEITVASFDIGKRNFAFVVEKFNEKEFLSLGKLPKKNIRYKEDGTCSEEFSDILNPVLYNGIVLVMKNIDLCKGQKNTKLGNEIFLNMIYILDKYRSFWDQCSVFIIEEQLSFGRKNNITAMKLAQNCQSYFLIHYSTLKEVCIFSSNNKTKVLGAPKTTRDSIHKSNKTLRKKWSIEKTIDILSERGDIDTLNIVLEEKKKDDISDAFLQLQAYKFLHFVEESI